jgi:hypothetical protein
MLEFLTQELRSLLQGSHLVHPASVEARNELLVTLRGSQTLQSPL